jgi:hypothetical protein
MILFLEWCGVPGAAIVYVHETATEKLAAARLAIDPEQPPKGVRLMCEPSGFPALRKCVRDRELLGSKYAYRSVGLVGVRADEMTD